MQLLFCISLSIDSINQKPNVVLNAEAESPKIFVVIILKTQHVRYADAHCICLITRESRNDRRDGAVVKTYHGLDSTRLIVCGRWAGFLGLHSALFLGHTWNILFHTLEQCPTLFCLRH